MKRGAARLLSPWLLTLAGATGVACERSEQPKGAGPAASTAASGAKLDGMQLSSARKIALESAVAALQHRDLARLKQLDGWVKNRAQVVLFEPDDVRALELAISCLENAAPPPDALAELSALRSGTLRAPARSVCGSSP